MSKGGYQIIDLGGVNISESPIKAFDGIYDLIEGTKDIPFMITNFKIGDIERGAFFATFFESGGRFATMYRYKEYIEGGAQPFMVESIIVDDDDMIYLGTAYTG